MINVKCAKRFCKEDISKIENYDKAIADTTQTWHCHHRTEIWWNCSKKELIDNECYYNRKACELIFLTPTEHNMLHKKGDKNPFYGKHHTEESRKKMSAALTGRTFSEEYRKNMSIRMTGDKNPMHGRHFSEESKRKISASQKARWSKKKGEI